MLDLLHVMNMHARFLLAYEWVNTKLHNKVDNQAFNLTCTHTYV